MKKILFIIFGAVFGYFLKSLIDKIRAIKPIKMTIDDSRLEVRYSSSRALLEHKYCTAWIPITIINKTTQEFNIEFSKFKFIESIPELTSQILNRIYTGKDTGIPDNPFYLKSKSSPECYLHLGIKVKENYTWEQFIKTYQKEKVPKDSIWIEFDYKISFKSKKQRFYQQLPHFFETFYGRISQEIKALTQRKANA